MTDCLSLIWESRELILSRSPLQGTWVTPSPRSVLQKERLLRPSRVERVRLVATHEALTDTLNILLTDRPRDLPIWMLIPPAWVYQFNVTCPSFDSPEEAFDHIVWDAIQRINGDIAPHRILVPNLTPGEDCQVITVRSVFIDLIVEAAQAANVELAGVGVLPVAGEEYIFDRPHDLRRAEQLSEDYESTYAAIGASRFPFLAVAFICLAILSFGAYLLLKAPAKKSTDAVTEQVADTVLISETQPLDTLMAAAVDTVVAAPGEMASVTPSPPAPVTPAPSSTAPTPSAPTPAAANPFSQIWQLLPSGSKVEFATISSAELRLEVSGLVQPREWLRQAVMLKNLTGLKLEGEFDGFDGRRVALLRLSSPGFPESPGVVDASQWNLAAGKAGLTVIKGRQASAAGDFNAALKMIEELWKNSAGGAKIYLFREGGKCVLSVG